MASKPKKQTLSEATFEPIKAYPLSANPNDRDHTARSTARLASISTVAATRVIAAAEGKAGMGELLDIPALIKLMREQATAVQGGNLAEAEAMLINQATALQAIFVRLIEKGMAQDQLLQYETHMRLALRAQSQCRATIEALAAIKNPPVIYAKQANVTSGPQQINNGTAAPSQARQIESEQTQLSGGNHELLQDTRASGKASRANPALETLGEIDRAEVPRG
jgi:hypothetical protein